MGEPLIWGSPKPIFGGALDLEVPQIWGIPDAGNPIYWESPRYGRALDLEAPQIWGSPRFGEAPDRPQIWESPRSGRALDVG